MKLSKVGTKWRMHHKPGLSFPYKQLEQCLVQGNCFWPELALPVNSLHCTQATAANFALKKLWTSYTFTCTQENIVLFSMIICYTFDILITQQCILLCTIIFYKASVATFLHFLILSGTFLAGAAGHFLREQSIFKKNKQNFEL